MMFKEVIVLGTGKLAAQCAKAVQEYDVPVVVYDTNQTKSSLLHQSLKKSEIDCKFEDKSVITKDLMDIRDEVLLVSAINPYIVPNKVLEKTNLFRDKLPLRPASKASRSKRGSLGNIRAGSRNRDNMAPDNF